MKPKFEDKYHLLTTFEIFDYILEKGGEGATLGEMMNHFKISDLKLTMKLKRAMNNGRIYRVLKPSKTQNRQKYYYFLTPSTLNLLNTWNLKRFACKENPLYPAIKKRCELINAAFGRSGSKIKTLKELRF